MPAPRPTPRPQDGFTLIEVLVAFVLMALLLGGFYQVFASGLDSAHRIEQRAHATMHAQSLLDQTDTVAVAAGFGETADGYAWQIDREPYLPETEAPPTSSAGHGLFFVRAVVWPMADRAAAVTITTLRLGSMP